MAEIVLLHPWPQDHAFWDPVAQVLRQAGHSVTAPDLPGFGDRAREPGWTMAGEADRLADEVPQGAVVVGLSMGGYVAQALVAAHPDRIGMLVLADTRCNAEDAAARQARQGTADMLRQDGSAEFIESFVPNVVGPDAPEPVRARLRELAARQSPDAMADAMEAMAARADTSGVLRALAVPALVICGEFDKGAPPALHAEMAALIPDASLAVIGGAGHMSAAEQPQEFAELVLARIDSAGV